MHGSHDAADTQEISDLLITKVRNATQRFLDVNVAIHDGRVTATPCVSGPDTGAMGVHFVLPSRLGDCMLNPNEPEALIYEPMQNGALRLVGVDFIVFAADWAAGHPEGGTPGVDGHLTNYVCRANRFGCTPSANCTYGRGSTTRAARSPIGTRTYPATTNGVNERETLRHSQKIRPCCERSFPLKTSRPMAAIRSPTSTRF